MEKMLRKKPIYSHKAPLETLVEVEEEMKVAYSQYGSLFKNKDEFEYFHMLPLDNNQRRELINVLLAESEERRHADACEGTEGSSSAHRNACMECCVLYKPALSKPYY